MTSSPKIITIAFLLLACLSCQSRKEPITQLQDQLRNDSATLEQLQATYQVPLRNEFNWCDSMLQYVPKEQVGNYFDALNLAQAYLSQFDENLPKMRNDIQFALQQLRWLKVDIDTHYVSDSLAQAYLLDEQAVADTLHHRVLYFQDRLSKQDLELQQLRKDLTNAAKP